MPAVREGRRGPVGCWRSAGPTGIGDVLNNGSRVERSSRSVLSWNPTDTDSADLSLRTPPAKAETPSWKTRLPTSARLVRSVTQWTGQAQPARIRLDWCRPSSGMPRGRRSVAVARRAGGEPLRWSHAE